MISLINAGPGTGKTFSLIHSYLKLKKQLLGLVEFTDEQQAIVDYVCTEFHSSDSVCFFSHSRTVKETLERKLGKKGPKVMTFHGAGQAAIIKKYGYQKLSYTRTENHIEQITGQSVRDMDKETKQDWYAIKKIVHYLKTEALDPLEENLNYLLAKYPDLSNYTVPSSWETDVDALLRKAAMPDGCVEFADMVWLGKKVVQKPIYKLGFVDESQDVSNSTFQLVTRLCENVIFCGDPNQAINAFAGASEEMFNKIASHSDAILPLKMTQRCPPAICKIANQTRPNGIIEGPNKVESEICKIDYASLPEKLGTAVNPQNSLFISRTNASVVGLAIFFHKKDIPCQIVDKDLAKEINGFIKSMRCTTIPSLMKKLSGWLYMMERSRSPLWRQMCKDKYEVIALLIKECESYNDIARFVKTVFEKHPLGFKITTIHKAKGLEADNIFVINPPIPLKVAMDHPISAEQEINLKFVAETRSSKNYYGVV